MKKELKVNDNVLFSKCLDVDDESGFEVGIYSFIIASIDDDGMIANSEGDLFEPDELTLIVGGNKK